MSTVRLESFDTGGLAPASLPTRPGKWDEWHCYYGFGQVGGRHGYGQYGGSTPWGIMLRKQWAGYATAIVGGAVYYYPLAGLFPAGEREVYVFAGDGNATTHVTITISGTDGKLRAYRGTKAGMLLGTSADTGVRFTSTPAWNYIEAKCVLSDTTGSVVVRITGPSGGAVTWLNLTNVDTKNGGTGIVIDNVQIWDASQHIPFDGDNVGAIWDDIYIFDGSGTRNNDFVGDCTVQRRGPNTLATDVAYQWTYHGGSGGYQNANLVNDALGNGDGSYTEGASTGDKALYTYLDLVEPANPSVALASPYVPLAVQLIARAEKMDSGSRSIAFIARLSGTEAQGSDQALTQSLAQYIEIWDAKPGGGAWTIADYNNAAFGQIARP